MRKIVFGLIFLLLLGCNRTNTHSVDSKKRLEDVITSELINSGVNTNNPILFVAEGMCAECINSEFVNLQSDTVLQRAIIIVGLFSRKRHFISTLTNLTNVRTVYIKHELMKDRNQNETLLFYAIYNAQLSKLTHVFYPDPCNAASTLNYYKNIKNRGFK